MFNFTIPQVMEMFHQYMQDAVDEGKISQENYNMWFGKAKIVKIENNSAYFEVESAFHVNIITTNYMNLMKEIFYKIYGVDYTFYVDVCEDELPVALPNVTPKKFNDVNYDLTFETFIVGRSNEFAYAASTQVARATNVEKAYNPLFIYGPSGMGKTHLLNAIYHEILTIHPEKNVILVTGESFTNELLDYISKRNTPGYKTDFKTKYRSADVLLIDDVHFIAGKEATQEEFFHTFNDLYEKGKQIVITSDRPPKDIKTLEDRIRTRFEWGLIADISAPEYETRVAIIKRKAKLNDFVIPDEVVEYIANRLKTNIRQLEGCVNKLKATHYLMKTPPTIIQAQNTIREILSDDAPVHISVDSIINDVATVYGVTKEDILSKKRSGQISTARKICAYIIKQVMQISLNDIGKELGGKDHSTIVYYIEDVNKIIEKDERTKETIEDIIKNLQNM